MKTKILSIAITLLAVFSISAKTFAATQTTGVTTTLTDISKINQIEVHGNVELYVTTGDNDKVKVYDSYYNQNALVQEQNGVLRISSYKTETLVVWVTVADLHTISAYDNATVKSFGKLSSLDFSLNLNNNATAQLDMDCVSATMAINDNAKADISGYAEQSHMVSDRSATVNTAKYTAATNVQKRRVAVVATKYVAGELAFN